MNDEALMSEVGGQDTPQPKELQHQTLMRGNGQRM
jgi:hypothetical protein